MPIMAVIFSLILLSNFSFSSALPDDSGNKIDFTYSTPINYSLIPTVNSTEYWNTNLGSLGDVNSTQFSNNGGTLNILESWLNSFVIGLSKWDNYLLLSGGTMSGDIDLDGNDIRDVDDMWVNGTFRSGVDGNIFVYDIYDEIHHLGADLQRFDELRANVFTTQLNVATIHNVTGDYINITSSDGGRISFISVESGIAKSDSFDESSYILELTAGTNETPILNRVYAYISGDAPHWGVSTTEVLTPHASVGNILLGDAGEFPYSASLQEDGMNGMVKRTQRRFQKEGLLYVDGFDYTATADDLEITNGSYLNGIYDNDFLNTINVSEGFYHVHTDGTYHWLSGFDSITTYSNDVTIGNNKYFNVIWGITPYDGTGNIYAVIQDEPNTEYTSTTLAWADGDNVMNVYPSVEFLKTFFVPVARTIIKKGDGAQLLPTGAYAEDYRGGIAGGASSGGGLSEVDPIWTVDKPNYLRNDENINLIGYNTSSDYFIGDGSQLTGIDFTDTNASTACSSDEVLLGNGSCISSSGFGGASYWDRTGTILTSATAGDDINNSGSARFDGGVGVGTDPTYPFHLQMASDDTSAFYVDGVTTPYSSWTSDWTYAPFKQHSKLTGSGSIAGFELMSALMIDNQLEQEFVLTGSPLAGILQNKGIYNYVKTSAPHTASTIIGFVEDNFGLHNFVEERPRTISASGSSLNRIKLVGILNEVKTSPIFYYNHAGTTLEKEMVGEDIWVQALQHDVTSGTLNLNAYGIRILVSASTSATTSNAYGLYIDNMQANHDLYGIYMNEDDTSLKNHFSNDNQINTMGTGKDYEEYFDGINQIYNLTTGGLHYFDGGNISVTGINYHSEVDNSTDALEWFKDGNDLILPNGEINHTAFGECYVNETHTDKSRPIITLETMWELKLISNDENESIPMIFRSDRNETEEKDELINKLKKHNIPYTLTESQFNKTIYPYKIYKDAINGECLYAKQNQALGLLNNNINLHENLTDFNTGIMAENIYTQSKVIDDKKDYWNEFTKEKIGTKETHKNYELLTSSNIKEEDRGVLNVEDRIVDLEGVILEIKKIIQLMLNKNTEQDSRLDDLETENSLLKSELCKKDKTYSWCKGGGSL